MTRYVKCEYCEYPRATETAVGVKCNKCGIESYNSTKKGSLYPNIELDIYQKVFIYFEERPELVRFLIIMAAFSLFMFLLGMGAEAKLAMIGE